MFGRLFGGGKQSAPPSTSGGTSASTATINAMQVRRMMALDRVVGALVCSTISTCCKHTPCCVHAFFSRIQGARTLINKLYTSLIVPIRRRPSVLRCCVCARLALGAARGAVCCCVCAQSMRCCPLITPLPFFTHTRTGLDGARGAAREEEAAAGEEDQR
jgi:hypothetical protein